MYARVCERLRCTVFLKKKNNDQRSILLLKLKVIALTIENKDGADYGAAPLFGRSQRRSTNRSRTRPNFTSVQRAQVSSRERVRDSLLGCELLMGHRLLVGLLRA